MVSLFKNRAGILALTLPAVFILCISGCEKPVHQFGKLPFGKHLVINGSMGQDQPPRIHISSSMMPQGKDIVENIENANVTITDEFSNKVYPGHDSMGFYMADWLPEVNRKYFISVSAPGYEDASAEIRIPQSLTDVSLSVDSSDINYPFVLRINDRPEDENTYMIRTWYRYKEIRHLWNEQLHWFYDTIDERRSVLMRSKDELITYSADGNMIGDSEFGEGERSSTGFLISDEFFNGKEHILRFKPTYIRMVDPDRPYMFVEVLSLTGDFYNYVRSYSLYYKARQDPFAEPIAILTNIKNGLGFVYGYSIHTDSIKVE